MILVMFFLFGFVQHVLSIQCYTCSGPGFFCPLPLNLDTGDEHTDNEIVSSFYDSEHVCQSDHFIDRQTGLEKIILRGIRDCEELNVINHRIYCCDKDNCNKWLPSMAIQPFTYSNDQRYLPSMILIVLSVIVQYFY